MTAFYRLNILSFILMAFQGCGGESQTALDPIKSVAEPETGVDPKTGVGPSPEVSCRAGTPTDLQAVRASGGHRSFSDWAKRLEEAGLQLERSQFLDLAYGELP